MNRRSPLSIVALQTHKALFWLSSIFALGLFVSYLFLMNHLAMQGYLLSKETQQNERLASQLEQLEATAARVQSREFITKSTIHESLIVQGGGKTYVIVPSKKITAQR